MVQVVRIPSGVAVVARDTWSAMQGRKALTLTWDDAGAERQSTESQAAAYKAMADKPGLVASKSGDAAGAIKGAAKVLEAEFNFPYLAHAPMEPLNATIERAADGSYDIHAGSQFQTIEQAVAAAILGTTADKVRITTLWAGGSFGRRATASADYIAEAAAILKATGEKAPIHLVWTREDDITGGYYRPAAYHRIRAGLDAKGAITGWEHRIVGKSIIIGTALEAMMVKDGVDATTVEGAADTPYALPAYRFEVHNAREGVPVLWWRSVGHSHTAQAMEVFIDELAHAAGQDPVAYRLGLLRQAPRLSAALTLAAEKAGWSARETKPDAATASPRTSRSAPTWRWWPT